LIDNISTFLITILSHIHLASYKITAL